MGRGAGTLSPARLAGGQHWGPERVPGDEHVSLDKWHHPLCGRGQACYSEAVCLINPSVGHL